MTREKFFNLKLQSGKTIEESLHEINDLLVNDPEWNQSAMLVTAVLNGTTSMQPGDSFDLVFQGNVTPEDIGKFLAYVHFQQQSQVPDGVIDMETGEMIGGKAFEASQTAAKA